MRSFRLHVPPFFMAVWLACAVIGAIAYALWLGATEGRVAVAQAAKPINMKPASIKSGAGTVQRS
jgi:hypothetical protein